MPKSFLQSKTNWFGLAVAVIPVLQWFLDENVLAQYPELISFIGAAIIILRKLTDTPVQWSLKQPY